MNHLSLTIHPWIIRLFCTYVFVLPFSSWVASIVLAVLLIISLIYKISEKELFRFSSFIMFWLIAFYVLHVTGLIYTSDFCYAGLDLQIKLSFLLMPFMLDAIPVSSDDYRRITRSFIAGCTLLSLILLTNAFIEYYIWHDKSSFFYIDFCSIQHVAYFTLYINCTLFFLADEFFRLPGYRVRNRKFLIIWMIFLTLIITLLASRTALIAVVISFSLYIYWLFRISRNRTTSAIYSGIAALTMVIIFLLVSGNNNRFEESSDTITSNTEAAIPNNSGGIQHNVRFEVWKNTLAVYRDHPLFGVGTGDLKNELNQQYKIAGFNEGLEFNLSPHNQFLHTLLLLGIPGLTVLLLIFILSLWQAILYKNKIMLALLIAVVINCLTEGILEKQAGVLFFVFFLILFANQQKNIMRPRITEA
jgi:O-antigen ligase